MTNIPRTIIARDSSDPAAAIHARKATIIAMLAELANRVAIVPAVKDWGVVGDLGYLEERLAELVNR